MKMEKPIKVVLADDHTLIRQTLSEMLEASEDVEVVGEAENGAEAVALAVETRPDVILLDVEMPTMGALEAIELITETSPNSKVVILTMYDDPGLVRELLARGASGYLVKTISKGELISALNSVAKDETRVILSLSRGALERAQKQQNREGLSERELELLLLVARGLSNNQIAASLYLTEGTVKRHLHNIYTKMDVASRGEATRKALSEGWITARDITRANDDASPR